jgi:hypothetical protein
MRRFRLTDIWATPNLAVQSLKSVTTSDNGLDASVLKNVYQFRKSSPAAILAFLKLTSKFLLFSVPCWFTAIYKFRGEESDKRKQRFFPQLPLWFASRLERCRCLLTVSQLQHLQANLIPKFTQFNYLNPRKNVSEDACRVGRRPGVLKYVLNNIQKRIKRMKGEEWMLQDSQLCRECSTADHLHL